MSDDGNFLSRWSRRKIDARRGEKEADPPKPADVPEPPAVAGEPVIPAEAGIQPAAPARVVLPPVDSLTIDSDFSPFMQPGVDPGLKREALKKLVRDPRFNVMDGLDVYIDDYSKPDPLPEGWLEKLNQVKYLGHYLEPNEGEAPALQKAIEEPSVEPDSAAPAPVVPDEEKHDSE